MAGVTPDNILTHPSTPRHRLLGEAVALLRLAERTGQGIDRAYREMLRVGKEPPQIADDGLSVRATLPGGIGNDAFVRFVQDLPGTLSGDVEVLITLALLRTATTVDATRLAQAIQRTPAEAQEVLARMNDRDIALLEPTRRTLHKPFPAYRLRNDPLAALARAVSYRRRTIDQIDEKVIEHVQEYGFVTNRTLQRLFDRDLYASRNLLNDLRDRGLLQKLGTARVVPVSSTDRARSFPKRSAQLIVRTWPTQNQFRISCHFPTSASGSCPLQVEGSELVPNWYPSARCRSARAMPQGRCRPSRLLTPKPRGCGAFGACRRRRVSPSSSADSGGGIRTRDLRVMSWFDGVVWALIRLFRAN